MHEWTAPSGVKVSSCVPQPKETLVDTNLAVHMCWSYWQWSTKILGIKTKGGLQK